MKQLPDWFDDWTTGRRARPTGRIAFSTVKFFPATAPLVPSGLLGPVRLVGAVERAAAVDGKKN